MPDRFSKLQTPTIKLFGDYPASTRDTLIECGKRANLLVHVMLDCCDAKKGRPGDIWYLNEVWIVIRGQPHWLWRAVDHDGYVLDEIPQTRWNTNAAKRLLTQLFKRQGLRPGRMVTDKLKSYGAVRRKMRLSLGHLLHKGLNNRAENSHLPLRKRERVMQKNALTGRVSALRPCFLRTP